MACARISLVVLTLLLAAGDSAAQMLPPTQVSTLDTRRKIGGDEGLARCREAISALRQGDLRSISLKLAGSDFVVASSEIPELEDGERQFFQALVTYAEQASHSHFTLSAQGIGSPLSLASLVPDSDLTDPSDVDLLGSLMFWECQISPLAWEYAQQASRNSQSQEASGTATRLLHGIESLTGEIVSPPDRVPANGMGIEVWKCLGPEAPQPLVLTWVDGHSSARSSLYALFEEIEATYSRGSKWLQGRDVIGALTVDRNASETQPEKRYRVVFRDLDGPPLVLMECGPELPDEEVLLSFATQFLPEGTDSWWPLRQEMEAVFALQAELAPLASDWAWYTFDSVTLMNEQIENPLRARKSWDWDLRIRCGAGQLNDLRVVAEMSASGYPMERKNFCFQYGAAGPPTWEVLGYVNRDVEGLDSASDAPDRLEHFHFAVGTGDERLHVASFRLLSDRGSSQDRVYSLQYLTRKELVTLDVMSEPPSFDEFCTRVLDWVNAWPDQSGPPSSIVNMIGMTLVLIPPGEFLMGSPEDEDDRDDGEVQHRVRITQPFYMGVTEVTQGQWHAVMGTRPWAGANDILEGPDYPATHVSLEDAMEFCRKLSALPEGEQSAGRIYRLPTEAEWEYACRGGTTGAYSFGTDSSQLNEYAWYEENARNAGEAYAHMVGTKKSNGFGLHDMHGNVWELCNDWYGDYPNSAVTDPSGPSSGSYRVIRGGSWVNGATSCRAAFRGRNTHPARRAGGLGFRLALSPPGE